MRSLLKLYGELFLVDKTYLLYIEFKSTSFEDVKMETAVPRLIIKKKYTTPDDLEFEILRAYGHTKIDKNGKRILSGSVKAFAQALAQALSVDGIDATMP